MSVCFKAIVRCDVRNCESVFKYERTEVFNLVILHHHLYEAGWDIKYYNLKPTYICPKHDKETVTHKVIVDFNALLRDVLPTPSRRQLIAA